MKRDVKNSKVSREYHDTHIQTDDKEAKTTERIERNGNNHLINCGNGMDNGRKCSQNSKINLSQGNIKQTTFTSLKQQIHFHWTHYVVALRPWSFTASVTPVALGSVLAYQATGTFYPSVFLFSLITALSVHAAGNLVNTYFDYFHGIDSKKSDDRTLVDKILSPQDVAWLGGVFYIIGCLGFLCLTFLSPSKMEHLALIYFGGLSGSFLYTGGLGLKYIALGDLLIFLTFGPVTVMFSFLCQTGQLSLICILYAIPLALNTEAILHSNNTRDMESDYKAGIVTIAILLGHTGSYILFTLLLFIPYLIYVMMAIHCTKWMFLPASSLFLAFGYEKDFRRSKLKNLPQKIAKLNLIMGLLYVAACFCANKENLPKVL